MKKIILTIALMMIFANCASAERSIEVNVPQTSGTECSTKDYSYFTGYRMFWSYVAQKKPSDYPGYWALVPETWKSGYTGSVCKNVVEQGYGQIKLKAKKD